MHSALYYLVSLPYCTNSKCIVFPTHEDGSLQKETMGNYLI